MRETIRQFTKSDFFTMVIFPLVVAVGWTAGKTIFETDTELILDDPGVFLNTLRTAVLTSGLVFLKAKGPDLLSKFLGGRPPEQAMLTAVRENTAMAVTLEPGAVQEVAAEAGIEGSKKEPADDSPPV